MENTKQSKIQVPNFEAEIKKMIEIHIKGDSTYYTAKTEEEAKNIAKRLVKETREKWIEENGEETRRQEELKYIQHNISNYTEHLKKRLWHMTRNGTSKEIIDEVKRIRQDLLGVLTGTKRVEWHQGHFNDSSNYSITIVKDYDRGE